MIWKKYGNQEKKRPRKLMQFLQRLKNLKKTANIITLN
jgi:hypothetical protein